MHLLREKRLREIQKRACPRGAMQAAVLPNAPTLNRLRIQTSVSAASSKTRKHETASALCLPRAARNGRAPRKKLLRLEGAAGCRICWRRAESMHDSGPRPTTYTETRPEGPRQKKKKKEEEEGTSWGSGGGSEKTAMRNPKACKSLWCHASSGSAVCSNA